MTFSSCHYAIYYTLSHVDDVRYRLLSGADNYKYVNI